MEPESLDALHAARPFRPFLMHLSDGRSVRVMHSEVFARGGDTLVVFDVAGCELQARLPPRLVRRAGDPVKVTIAPEAIHLFDPATGRRL